MATFIVDHNVHESLVPKGIVVPIAHIKKQPVENRSMRNVSVAIVSVKKLK
jgi:hypothetical protein